MPQPDPGLVAATRTRGGNRDWTAVGSVTALCFNLGSGCFDRLAQPGDITDLVGEHQDETRVERNAGLVIEAPVGIDQEAIGFVGVDEPIGSSCQPVHVRLRLSFARFARVSPFERRGKPTGLGVARACEKMLIRPYQVDSARGSVEPPCQEPVGIGQVVTDHQE